jgi:hypothetical protein
MARLDNIAAEAVGHLFGRMLKRTAVAVVLVVCVIVAIYHASVAGILAMETPYGAINAHLIMFGIYGGLALIALIALWATGRKPADTATPALSSPRQMQMAMIVEAVMLGYALARKGNRAR